MPVVQCRAVALNSNITSLTSLASLLKTISTTDHANTNVLTETGSVIFHPVSVEIKFKFLYEDISFIKFFIQNYTNDEMDLGSLKYPYSPMIQAIKEEIMIDGKLKSLYSGAVIYTKNHLQYLPGNLDKCLLNWFANCHNPIKRN